jgi:Lrp/AsnC family transcriptional regulator for asnA, asnC and gidA
LKDGRKDFTEIAEEIGVSKNTIWKHYKEMEKSGILIGATTHVNNVNLGYFCAEILVLNVNLEEGRVEETIKKIPNALIIPNVLKGALTMLFVIDDLNELEKAKGIIRQHLSSAEVKTQVWTGVRNITENLSFGLPAVVDKICETQSQQTTGALRKKCELDETDMKIIDKLSENGRSPFRRIAQEIGVTTDTVARRYKRLKGNRIVNVVIQIDPQKIGYHATLECRIRLKSHRDLSSTIEALSKIPDVFHISASTGDYDLHVWALIRSIKHFFAIQDKIAAVPDFGRMETELTKAFLDIYPYPHWQITTI